MRQFVASRDILPVILWLGMLSAMMVIIAAARGDLWLDEVWSLLFAETAKSPWEIVSVYKHDNNHVLNTLILYLIGKQNTLLYYRIPAILSGLGSLLIVIKIARKWGDAEAILAMLMAGASYPLVLYFSEARGYAPAMFFSLLAFLTLQNLMREITPWRVALFWLALVLGTLSHLTFVMVFLALIAFSAFHEFGSDAPFKSRLRHITQFFFLPGVFFVVFYFYYAKGMMIGGGDFNDKFTEINKGYAYLLALPGNSISYGIPVLTAVTLATAGIYLLYRNKDGSWVFYLSVLVAVPALVVLAARSEQYYFRYLIVCFPFFCLLLSYVLGRLYRMGGGKFRAIVALVMCLYLLGQSQKIVPLLQVGRGDYRGIMAEISAKSAGARLTVGSDHDFRNGMLLAFYSRFLPPSQTLTYVTRPNWSASPPEWFITHSAEPSFQPPPILDSPELPVYALTKVSSFSGDSGFRWFLYHRAN